MKSYYLYTISLLAFLLSTSVFSHQLSTSYITLSNNANPEQFIGKWEISVADLEHIIPLDTDKNSKITWPEIKAKQQQINANIRKNLIGRQNNNACALDVNNEYQLSEHFNRPYLVFPIIFSCPSKQGNFTLTYTAFFKHDSDHTALIAINKVSRVFSKDKMSQTFNFEKTSYFDTFKNYVYQGVLHIWIGIDHILFLIALLLTCVLKRENNAWQAIASKKQIIKHTAWIVTAFTLAHSITLTATAMDLIVPNSRWVEISIAVSVLFAALNNVWPIVLRLGWLTFVFGLLHGMGFASVLGELGLSSNYQLMSILAFNLGVEIGQLSILLFALPLLISIRNYKWYRKWLMPLSSIVIALIALQWSIERF